MTLTFLPFIVLAAGGLTVDTPSPDALCPPLEQTRSAVESRLGSVELEGTWHATYFLAHRAEGDVVALELRDPLGTSRLMRQFAMDGSSCSTLAQAIAIVLERYFLQPDPALRRVEGQVRLVLPGRQAVVPRPNPASGLMLDGGLWASNVWIAPTLGLGYRHGRAWSLGLRVGYDLADHAAPIDVGQGISRRLPVALQGTRLLGTVGPVRLHVGVGLVGLYEQARTIGLAVNGSAARWVPGLDLSVAAEPWPKSASIGSFIGLSAGMLLTGATRPFEVDHRPAFELPTFVGGVHFGIRKFL